MSGVLALINELLKSNNPKENILSTIYDFDKVLRLNLNSEIVKEENVDSEIEGILKQREEARLNKNFLESDRLRDLILSKGYKVLDTPNGQTLEKI
ncbi:MAG: Cysteine-tRNA ligase [candidate division WS6 bacterium GW2011_GWB1_33_6]|nr:MAG: Cysteine-tRNA ligase [candidate division WS6 bacterium GW2011_GWB1_33_6]